MPERLIYMLEHEYTEVNLRLEHLKASDQKRAHALIGAGGETGFEIFLCNIEREVYGGADEEDDDWGYGGRGRNWGGTHEITEVQHDKLRLTKVVRPNGTPFLSNVKIKKRDIVQKDPFEGKRKIVKGEWCCIRSICPLRKISFALLHKRLCTTTNNRNRNKLSHHFVKSPSS